MVDLETLMKEAKAEEEREARESRDIFLNVIDRARVEQAKQVKEDPMLMWSFATRDKEPEHKKAESLPVVQKVKSDYFWNGFMSGIFFAVMMALMVVLVWWFVWKGC